MGIDCNTTLETVKPDYLGNVLKNAQPGEYSFLFGNGINYALNSNVSSWEALIKEIGKEVGLADFLERNNISLTEWANLIEIRLKESAPRNNQEEIGDGRSVGKRHETINNLIGKHIRGKVNSKCHILDYAWSSGQHILTTNFDECIEKYLARVNACHFSRHIVLPKDDGGKYCRSDGHYNWNHFWGTKNDYPEEKQESLPLGHDIWHIHGKADQKRSLSLIASMTKYCSAIRKVSQMRQETNDGNWEGMNSWLELFFNRPLIIAGLGLLEKEIFPRYLLLRKAQWRQSGAFNRQSFYLIGSESDAVSDGRCFLKMLGFTIVEFPNRSEIYNSEIWQNLSDK